MSLDADSLKRFDQLVSEALAQEFSGWDFSYVERRIRMAPLPWDYVTSVRDLLPATASLLDMGTGGGELLASLAPLPAKTVATEAFAPNIPIARARLGSLGVPVVALESDHALPFEDGQFDLVINRHESFSAREVGRVLRPGGRFITQQVGGKDNFRLNELLQDEPEFEFAAWSIEIATAELSEAGFVIIDLQEEFPDTSFADIGAVVFYLKAVPWQIADFSVDGYLARLRALHAQIERDGDLVVQSHRFIIEAVKP